MSAAADRFASEVAEHLIAPNSRPQHQFLASPAHVVIGGGAAGGGKTFVQLLDPMRFMYGTRPDGSYFAPVPGYSAVFFRRTSPEITNEGGMWDESMEIFGPMNHWTPVPGILEWRLPVFQRQQCTLRMTHLQYEWTVNNWYGSQVPYMSYDQIEQFTEKQFFTMLTRNRSATGIPGLTRGGCNPDPDSFIYDLVSWWIDHREELVLHGRKIRNPGYGYPYPARSGVVRWFVRLNNELVWADTRQELYSKLPRILPKGAEPRHMVKSFTFIPFKAEDNVDLMRKDPAYIGNLLLQDDVQRERLLGGNWLIRPAAGKIFPKEKVKIIPVVPRPVGGTPRVLRYWDRAASEKKGSDFTEGVKMWLIDGKVIIEDDVGGQWGTAEREEAIANTASQDGRGVTIVLEEEPGSSGKDASYYTVTKTVPGYDVQTDRPSVDLELRSRGLAAQWQVGNVYIVGDPNEPWLKAFLAQMNAFDGKASTATKKDDKVAAATGAYNYLMRNDVGSMNPDDWATVRG
jgi:predicted phage terminase large subunit-like protein